MNRLLIVNADDFGASPGINRGILDAHLHGIVTSASLVVTGAARHDAAAISQSYPGLSVGLHWDVTGEDERWFNLDNEAAVRDEFASQLDAFCRLMGRMPTHIDSHQHVHREAHLMPLFEEMAAPLNVPVRGDGHVAHVGGFYGQWEWKVTDLDHIRVPFLQWMLREEVGPGWTEISCHPGYRSEGFTSVYDSEREVEIETLCDPGIRQTIEDLEIELVSYAAYQTRMARTSLAAQQVMS